MRSNMAVRQPALDFPQLESHLEVARNPHPRRSWAEGLRILYTGPVAGTCLQRAESLRCLGAEVVHVPSGIPDLATPSYQLFRAANRIKSHPDFYFANSRLIKLARQSRFDLVWIDKGLGLRPRTLRQLRAALPDARIVAYSGDDMCNPANQSERYLASLPLYDLHVTTKSYNVPELKALGAREMLFLDNSYDPTIHRPLDLSPEERRRYGSEVGFIGAYEAERADLMLRLAAAGIPVAVRGPGWNRFLGTAHPNLRVLEEWMDDEAYPRAINATRINLAFLRKVNRDLQTTRSIEIPACRAFMLAERTDEHRQLFREGVEAEFFADFEELLAKCRYYLAHPSARIRIAEQGQRRCVSGHYSYEGRLSSVLDRVMRIRPPRSIRPAVAPAPAFEGLRLQPELAR